MVDRLSSGSAGFGRYRVDSATGEVYFDPQGNGGWPEGTTETRAMALVRDAAGQLGFASVSVDVTRVAAGPEILLRADQGPFHPDQNGPIERWNNLGSGGAGFDAIQSDVAAAPQDALITRNGSTRVFFNDGQWMSISAHSSIGQIRLGVSWTITVSGDFTRPTLESILWTPDLEIGREFGTNGRLEIIALGAKYGGGMPILRNQTSHWIAVRWDGTTLEFADSDRNEWTAIPVGGNSSAAGATRLKRNGAGNSENFGFFSALDMRTGAMSNVDHQALVDSWAAIWGAWS